MIKLITSLQKTIDLPDHPIYHPEGTVNRHILLVCLKALIGTDNINIVLAALLHDACKGDDGKWVDHEEGRYWSNRRHAHMGAALVMEDDIRYWIKQLGADVQVVHDICKYHMDIKQGIPKKLTVIPHLATFGQLDDMVGRKVFPQRHIDSFTMVDGHTLSGISNYVGQTKEQIQNGDTDFTISIGTESVIEQFENIPNYFDQSIYKELQPYLEVLKPN